MGPIMSGQVIETFHLIIEWAAFGIELLAVAVIVGGVIILAVRRGTVRYLFQLGKSGPPLRRAVRSVGRSCHRGSLQALPRS